MNGSVGSGRRRGERGDGAGTGGNGAGLLPDYAGHWLRQAFEVDAGSLRDLLPSPFRRCGFTGPRVVDLTRTATARIERPFNDPLGKTERLFLHLAWRTDPAGSRAWR